MEPKCWGTTPPGFTGFERCLSRLGLRNRSFYRFVRNLQGNGCAEYRPDIGRFADVSRRKKSLDVGYVRVFSTGINNTD